MTMRDEVRRAIDDPGGRVLTVRLDWRSLIPVVVLVGGVWLSGGSGRRSSCSSSRWSWPAPSPPSWGPSSGAGWGAARRSA